MKIKKIIAAVLSLCIIGTATPLSAVCDFEDGDIWLIDTELETSGTCGENAVWSFDAENGVLTISGTGAVETGGEDPWNPLHKEITSIVVEEGITLLPAAIFSLCYSQTLDLPSTLTEIQGKSLEFLGTQPKLTAIRVAEGNPSYKTVDGVLFDKDMTVLLKYPMQKTDETYTVPETVKTLNDAAFLAQRYLTAVTLPDGLETISEAAFYNCKQLAKIDIPGSVTEICGNAFPGTPWLAEKQADDPLVVVNDILVNGLAAEGEIEIPDGVRRIAPYAFEYSEKITGVKMTDSVESIGRSAFFSCTQLTEIDLLNTKEVGIGAFCGCSELTSVNAGKAEKIDTYAFADCPKLEKITIGVKDCDIFDAAYTICYEGDDKKGYTFGGVIAGPSGSTAQAYAEKYGYTFEVIAETDDNIVKLNGVTYTIFEDHAEITSCDKSVEGKVVIPAKVSGVPVTTMGYGAFMGCTEITSVELPEGLTEIGTEAFHDCTKLETINYPESLEHIWMAAFSNCQALTSGELPDGIEDIGAWTFRDCYSLVSLHIPESVKKIEQSAFSGCSALTSLIFPESVDTIVSGAFDGCTSLKEMTFLNPDSTIWAETVSSCVIRGYKDSTAQAYAEEHGCTFEAIDGEPSAAYGDVNGDGSVNLNDAVAIMQYVALPAKYSLSESALELADVVDNGTSGVNGTDALAVMMVDAKLINADELPVPSDRLSK